MRSLLKLKRVNCPYSVDTIFDYEIFSPLPIRTFENSSFVNLDDCWGLCLDLSEEYGYAEVRHGNCVMGSYTNGQ